MTTAKTLKTLRTAFKAFEAAYVGVESVCWDAEAIDPGVASTMMEDMRAVHFQFRQMLADVERAPAMEDAT